MAVGSNAFRREGFGNPEDLGNHIFGAVLMVFGSTTALDCTIDPGLSGISTLSLGSMLNVARIVAGAYGATSYHVWHIEQQQRYFAGHRNCIELAIRKR